MYVWPAKGPGYKRRNHRLIIRVRRFTTFADRQVCPAEMMRDELWFTPHLLPLGNRIEKDPTKL